MSGAVLRPNPVSTVEQPLPCAHAGQNKRLTEHRFMRRFVMTAPRGLQVSHAVLFAKTTLEYAASILIAKKGGPFVNCKSIEGLLTLQARYGDEIVVAARGDDATDAVAAIARLFADAFGTRDTGESGKPRLLITNVPNAHRRALARGCA